MVEKAKKKFAVSETALSGMKEITAFVGRSEATVLDWVRKYGFPAKKISGQWESDRSLIEEWRVNQIKNHPKEDKKSVMNGL
ncbi:MerR family transcriptional regulator [Desulforegula conservatrix]|uniref:hypothetical protein n=1 Tax=Desulforegula conservatrix TaxID=153026 RepID=UPI00041A5D45|nr:hypothetical protein [Desulforegula conservatrix]